MYVRLGWKEVDGCRTRQGHATLSEGILLSSESALSSIADFKEPQVMLSVA